MSNWQSTLPQSIKILIESADWQAISEGESDADVIRLVDDTTRYLKVSRHDAQFTVKTDYERLNWLSGKIAVPEILAYEESQNYQFLLMSEIAGIHPFHDALGWSPQERIGLLAKASRQFHAIPIDHCPFRQSIDEQLAAAKHNVDTGRIRTDLFDPPYQGRDPANLYEELALLKPKTQDWAMTHGDLYPLNIRTDAQTHELLGFIDVGGAALADPYTDFAPIANAIHWHFGKAWISYFFEAFGIEPNWDKLQFFQLLNEFF
jgi:aminoglycoside phosphotransferase